MSGFWIVSSIVQWVVVIGLTIMILAMAKEIEVLHSRLDVMKRFIRNTTQSEKLIEEEEKQI